jgi:hypothetical protein
MRGLARPAIDGMALTHSVYFVLFFSLLEESS